jgi:hypothetical protein
VTCRRWLFVAAFSAVGVMVTYPIFFAATNAAFERGGLADSTVRALLGRWAAWHWVRNGTGHRRLLRSIASASAVMTLNSRAWLAVAILASVLCALLFGAARTTHYWQAWVSVSIFLGASALTTST